MNKVFAVKPARFLNKIILAVFLLGILSFYTPAVFSWNLLKSPQEFSKKLEQWHNVSLVFASQNLRVPISAFGHTLLLFHKQTHPEPGSIAFEYLGDTSAKFLIVRSLLWSLPGRFRLTFWNQKLWEYEQEDRDVWIIPLKLSSEERNKLNRKVKSSLQEIKPYNFLFTNCSWYIFKVLKESMEDMKCRVAPYVIPADTVRALYRCGKVGKPLYLASQAHRFNEIFKQLDSQDKRKFKKITKDVFSLSLLELLKAIEPLHENKAVKKQKESVFTSKLKSAVTEWVDYQIPRTDNTYKRNKLFQLKKQFYYPSIIEPKELNKSTSRIRRFTLSYWQNPNYTTLTFSPAYLRFLSSVKNSFWADKLEVMTISAGFNFKNFFISEFNILDMKAAGSDNVLRWPVGRELYLGYKKLFISEEHYIESWLARAGTGLSYNLSSGFKISANIFAETGVTGNFDQTDFSAGIGVSAKMFIRLFRFLRFKTEFTRSIGYNSLINQKLNMQLVFYDFHSVVMSADYLYFHTVKNTFSKIKNSSLNIGNNQHHQQLGVSFSFLY